PLIHVRLRSRSSLLQASACRWLRSRRFPPPPRLGARTPELRQFLPYRGGLGFPRRRPDLRRPARSRRSPWLPSHRPHRRPPFQRWRLHHNQLVPSPWRFPSTARLWFYFPQASRVYPAGLILYLPSSTPIPHRSTSRISFAARVPFALTTSGLLPRTFSPVSARGTQAFNTGVHRLAARSDTPHVRFALTERTALGTRRLLVSAEGTSRG